MRSERTWIPLIAVILMLPFLLLVGTFRYRTAYAKTEVLTSASRDGQYSLVVYMIGEPDWPFGATHCRFDLSQNGKEIVKYRFDVSNDGVFVGEDQFSVAWGQHQVSVTVDGEEQPLKTYVIDFSGTVQVGCTE